ncbi:hypothetical protein NHX12_021027 [Muraenolepis orangiensis]|uniref:MADF domain-containing protein n=1 Tax=Muraenolepis orangiensis TaxID=630683 RepID=A0A9Q0ESB6_9TELE|nr:hypothetical protein NHX12_021027 [Muraenolepis orangiensis]
MNQFEARLADIVRDFAHLYDRSRRDYNDMETVGKSWRDIAAKMDVKDPAVCKAAWRRLRDKFVKATKRMKGGGGDEKKKTPKLYVELSWMGPFVQPRRTATTTPTPAEPPGSRRRRKRRRDVEEEEDVIGPGSEELDALGDSRRSGTTTWSSPNVHERYVQHIADFMTRLSPRHLCKFKFAIQKVMFEAEQEMLEEH